MQAADPNPFPVLHLFWDLSGNTKVVGRWYLTFRTGKGRGLPVQATWLNETEPPWRYGRGVGVRLPRLMVSLGRWSKITQPEWEALPFEQKQKVKRSAAEMPTLSSQAGQGAWDDVLADA